ncbi:MAG: hypothetical protein J07HQW2_00666 [Haloquadratum walsbyi J07HQW2]|uniref:Uncharacterized protein n=1 Tax=Haloquadratum walsbyi J07HQW2 TaxID=1238425 RepID=U1PKM0_9EURY|nr:MAG: hypothetical protein J07HQW2_00666 [Haloquadratum walsbyi J07HQW2]
MTRDSLSQIRQGAPWDDAGVGIWKSRPEGSNAGNGIVMRCAPHGDRSSTFRCGAHSSQSAVIGGHTCRPALSVRMCDSQPDARKPDSRRTRPTWNRVKNTYSAPDELRTAVTQVQEVITGDRDSAAFESQLATSGCILDSLQAGIHHGVTA